MEIKPLLKRGGGPLLSSLGVSRRSFLDRSFASKLLFIPNWFRSTEYRTMVLNKDTVSVTLAEFFLISDFVVEDIISLENDSLLKRTLFTFLFEVDDTIEAKEITGPFTIFSDS